MVWKNWLTGKEKVPVSVVSKDSHAIIFWSMKESITIDFLEKGTTVNSASYCEFILQSSPYLLNDHHIYIYNHRVVPLTWISLILSHQLRQVLQTTSYIFTELLLISCGWSSNTCSFMWWGPQENVTYEFVLTFPAVSHVSCLSDFDSFRDGRLVAVQLLFCEILLQICSV